MVVDVILSSRSLSSCAVRGNTLPVASGFCARQHFAFCGERVMKNIAVLFLLLIAQAVLAQTDDFFDWRVSTDVDVIDDSVRVDLRKFASDVDSVITFGAEYATLNIICDEKIGETRVNISFNTFDARMADFRYFGDEQERFQVTYRVGTDEAVTHKWIVSLGLGILFYTTSYIDDGSGYSGTSDAGVLVAALVQDNSRFIVRVSHDLHQEIVTAIWNMEGLSEVIDQCMAVLD